MLTARCSLHTIQSSLFKSQYSLCSLFTSHCSQARKETDQDTKVRNAHVHVHVHVQVYMYMMYVLCKVVQSSYCASRSQPRVVLP